MDKERFYYKVEVNFHPVYEGNVDEPYFWVIWELDKTNVESKTNAVCGWASSPEEAFTQANRYYAKFAEKDLKKSSGIKEVWQPEYTLVDGTYAVGDCFESQADAQFHAACVEFVSTNDGPKEVAGFGTRKCRYIPKRK